MINRWFEFYTSIKDPSWPRCVNEHEFRYLPKEIQKEIIVNYNGSQYLELDDNDVKIFAEGKGWAAPFQVQDTSIKKFSVASDFDVVYSADIDGNGRAHSGAYPLMLAKLYPGQRFDSCLEWCAGPGFIGFRLISDDLVNSLTLMDKYQPALNACEDTWKQRPSRLKQKNMETVLGSTVDCLEDRMFDLVVANPPNFDHGVSQFKNSTVFRITQDPGWQTHTDFFLKIKKNLKPNGKILLIKDIYGSQPADHAEAIVNGGLKLSRVVTVKHYPTFYFLEVTHP